MSFFSNYIQKENEIILKLINVLTNLSDINYSDLLNSIYFLVEANEHNFLILIKTINDIITFKPNKYALFIKFLTDIHNKHFYKDDFVKIIFNFVYGEGEINFVKLKFLILLYENKLFDGKYILNYVDEYMGTQTYFCSLLFLIFYEEFITYNEDEKNLLKEFADELFTKNYDNPLTKKIILKGKDLLYDNIHSFRTLIKYQSLEDNLNYVIFNDDVDVYTSKYLNRKTYYDNEFLFSNTIQTNLDIVPSYESDLCAYYGSINIFKILLVNNRVNRHDDLYKFALLGGNREIIQILFSDKEKGEIFSKYFVYAILGYNSVIVEWLKEEKTKFANIEEYLMESIKYNNVYGIKTLIDMGAKFKSNRTNILQESILYDNIYITIYLTEYNPEIFDAKDENGNTPLHNAVLFFRTNFIQFLLSFPLLEVNTRNNKKLTPYLLASKCDNVEALYLFMDNKQINLDSTIDGNNALMVSARYSAPKTFKYLMETQRYFFDTKNNDGGTLYDITLEYPCLEIWKLIYKDDIDRRFPSKKMNTLLHQSCIKNYPIGLKWLVENNADPNLFNNEYDTPLLICIKKNFYRCFEILLSYDRVDINICDTKGMTPLHHAIHLNRRNMIEDILRTRKVDMNIKDRHGVSIKDLCSSKSLNYLMDQIKHS